jgi:hypothetical protein
LRYSTSVVAGIGPGTYSTPPATSHNAEAASPCRPDHTSSTIANMGRIRSRLSPRASVVTTARLRRPNSTLPLSNICSTIASCVAPMLAPCGSPLSAADRFPSTVARRRGPHFKGRRDPSCHHHGTCLQDTEAADPVSRPSRGSEVDGRPTGGGIAHPTCRPSCSHLSLRTSGRPPQGSRRRSTPTALLTSRRLDASGHR